MRKCKILLSLILLNATISFAQIKSIGIPKIVNFSKNEYNAGTQNWAIAQDSRGVMYFGNNDGLLEFDGKTWRLIKMPNASIVRALKVSKSGKVYIGAFSEFGYLQVDERGLFHYESLIDKVPSDNRNFGNVWKIYELDDGIIFQSFSEIFLYRNDEIIVIAQKRDFHFGFYLNNSFYITEKNKGLLILENDKLVKIKGSELFNNNIWSMLPLNSTKIIVGTTNEGLFLVENNEVVKWDIPVNDFLKENQIYCGTKIGRKYFAFGTIQNGILIIDNYGNPIQHINREKGLQNNTILSISTDNNNNLWLGLDNGIDYIIVNSPFTYLESDGEIGAGYASYIYNNKIYFGTNQGLFYQNWDEEQNPINSTQNINLVKNSRGQVWSLSEFNNKLICGHNEGTFVVENDKAIKISDVQGAWKFIDVPDYTNYIIGGTYSGLIRLNMDMNSKNWKFDKVINGLVESCRIMEYTYENNNHTIWMSHVYKGIFKLVLNNTLDEISDINFYNSNSGLRTDIGNNVLKFDNEIIFSNEEGIFKYDDQIKDFVSYEKFNVFFEGSGSLTKTVKDQNGNYWFFQGNEMGIAKLLNDGSYVIQKNYFKQLKGSFIASFENLYSYDEKNVIIGNDEGFIHYDPTNIKDINIPFQVLIRSVKTTNDSLIFGGSFVDEYNQILRNRPNSQLSYLPYKLNDLKFEFSATHYENLESIEYQYFLEGFETDWSDWTSNMSKEYTNLREGSYIFNVRAKNIFEMESEVSSFEFIIIAPWYRSVFAYILYVLIFSIIALVATRIIRNRIEKENKLHQLKQKREYQQQIQKHQNEVLSAEQEIIKLRNEKLRIEIDKNKADVELKNKELANYAMQITQKNEALNSIKEQLLKISKKVNPDAQKHIQKLIKRIDRDTKQQEDWDKFELYFDQVYEDFTQRIREKYTKLTPNDVKLCAYLRMNLSTKEIAPLLNISIRGVEISRYRLRKKLNLNHDENLIEFMMNL